MITNRDGIAGHWVTPTATPVPLKAGSQENLELWGPDIRAEVFDFELFSRVGFTQENGTASVWYLEGSPGNSPAYRPLLSLARPDEAIFKKQLELFLESYASLRPERTGEILAQLGIPNAFYGSIAYLHPERTPWTTELLLSAWRLAAFVELRLKHALACRRPIEYSPQVQPMIPTPRHGTLPSGHATEAFIFAFVLGKLLREAGTAAESRNSAYAEPLWAEQLMRFAARCAINRQVAGVHFPVDSVAGMALGLALGHYFVGRCGAADGWEAWVFDGSVYPPELDYDWRQYFDVKTFERSPALPHAQRQKAPAIEAKNSAIMRWLWEKAKAEWM